MECTLTPRWPKTAPSWPRIGPKRMRNPRRVHPRGPLGSRHRLPKGWSREFESPKRPQDGPKTAPRWPKMAPSWPKMAPRWLQYCPGLTLKSLKHQCKSNIFAWGVHLDSEIAQDGAKLAPKWPQDGPKRALLGSRHRLANGFWQSVPGFKSVPPQNTASGS